MEKEIDFERIKELLESKSFGEIKKILVDMNPADISQLFEEISEDECLILFRLLPKELAAESFVYFDSDIQEKLINDFSDKNLREILDELFLDDTVDIIEEMPANVATRILNNCTDPAKRREINEILRYPEDTAGSIMTVEYVRLKKTMTVKEAFDTIRSTGLDKETVYTCYVTDANRHLEGIVSVRTLLLSPYEAKIKDIMETNIIYVTTTEDKEEVAKQFNKYDLLAIPVVDKETRLVGIVTFDDAIDVMEEEVSEDFAKMAAITPPEDSYFKESVFKHAKNRILWLLILMVSSTITGIIITNYQEAFQNVPVLIAFLPMLMDTGGNCGAQSSTMIIRGMALDEIKLKDFFKALFKEMRIGLLISAALIAVNTIRVLIFNYNEFYMSLILGITLFCTVIIAKMLGCCLPMLAKLLKLDPAIMASPLITTIVDCCTVIIYFSVAVAILPIFTNLTF